MKILIACDDSEHSGFAIDDTLKSQWPESSQFKVISVADNSIVQPTVSKKPSEIAQAVVYHAVNRLQEGFKDTFQIEGEVLHGYPKSEIIKCAESWPCDLLIVGSRGHKGLARVLLGSVSHSLLVTAACSIRIARCNHISNQQTQKILLSLDESNVSDIIVDRIISRPWAAGTQFSCVTAIPTLTQYLYEVQDSHEIKSLELLRQQKITDAESRLEQIAQLIKSKLPDITVSSEVLNGDPREAVVEKAKQWGTSLLVIGCKGKNWLDRILIGSVSEAIATWADCSVEVIK